MTEYLLIAAALVAAIAAAVRWWFWREYKAKHADALLFLTHTPHAYQPEARAFAQALRGMADGFDQWRWWSRPDPLVMNTLRRAADELDKAGDAAAAERERCAKLVQNMDTTGHDGYIETAGDLCEALAACIRRA